MGLDYYFRPRVREKGQRLYVATHVYSVEEIDGAGIVAKFHSQQGKRTCSAYLQVNTNGFVYHCLKVTQAYTTALHDRGVFALLFLWPFISSDGAVTASQRILNVIGELQSQPSVKSDDTAELRVVLRRFSLVSASFL